MTARSDLVWWRHATVRVAVDGTTLLTDPLLTRTVAPLHAPGPRPPVPDPAGLDAVLVSHLHRDHLHLPSLRRLGRLHPRVRLLAPAGAARLLRGVAGPVEELRPGDKVRVGTVTVRATPAVHDPRRHPWGATAEPLGYVVIGSRTVYFAGDTGLFRGMADIADAVPGGLDVALLPIGGWGLTLGPGHLDPERAAEALTLLRPRYAAPVHYGDLRIPVAWRWRRGARESAPERFRAAAARTAPSTSVVVLEAGRPWAVPVAPLRDL